MTKQFKGKLINAGMDAKTVKGNDKYITAILYMAPADVAGGTTVCPYADKAGCREACLYTAGRGAFNNVQLSRIRKAQLYLNDREGFMADLVADLARFVKWCARNDAKPAVRLNGTSDIPYERIPVDGHANVFEAFPDVQFYDYTKVYSRVRRALPDNYRLTLSYSAASMDYANAVRKASEQSGVNMAIVLRDRAAVEAALAAYPDLYQDGDRDDLRFLDEAGKHVLLYAKGSAKKDDTGFVIDALVHV